MRYEIWVSDTGQEWRLHKTYKRIELAKKELAKLHLINIWCMMQEVLDDEAGIKSDISS